MSFYEKGPVRIQYEEAGSGFPLLLVPGGGLNSTITELKRGRPFNAIEEFKGEYRCIFSDMRNANGGQSFGPLEIDRFFNSYVRLVMVQNLADAPEAGPSLFLIGAQAALYGGRVDRARSWLARAEAVNVELDPGERLLALAMELMLAHAVGRTDDAVEIAEHLIEHYEANDEFETDPANVAESLFVAAMALAFVDQTGTYPPDNAFDRTMISGVISLKFSMARKRPVRPRPVCTSSATNRVSYRRHSARASRR